MKQVIHIPTCLLILLTALSTFCTHAQLVPAAKTTGVIAPGRAATLEFRVTAESIKADDLAYVVSDYAGANVAEGKARRNEKDANIVTLSLTVGPGYYEISFPALKQTFGVISVEPLRGRKDPFFCIDAGLSWLAPESADRQRLMTLMQQLSIDIARERLHWGSVNGGFGRFTWDGDRDYDTLRKRYELVGLGVLEIAHDTPKYLGPTEQNPYPADLVPASQAWAAIANRWRNAHAGIQIWNEPDIFFGGNLPADQYVAYAKAVSRGVSGARIPTPLGGGVLSSLENDAFLRGLSVGGLMRAVDFVSFHNYADDGASIRKQVARCRAWLEQAGAAGAGIWISECGKPWPATSGARAARPDDAASALAIVAKAVEARACGVERYFPFVLPFFDEHGKNFGMTGKDGTPLRSLAAYGACIATLTNRAYVGDLVMPLEKRLQIVRRAPVFADDATAVIVLYSDMLKLATEKPDEKSDKDHPRHWFDWGWDMPIIKILGIDGRELTLVDNGNKMIPLNDGLAYVLVAVRDLDKFLEVETDAMKLTRQARLDHSRTVLPPVVLQHRPDFATVAATSNGWRITKGDAKKWPLAIRVNNFSQEEEITLTLHAYPADATATAIKPAATATRPATTATTRPTATTRQPATTRPASTTTRSVTTTTRPAAMTTPKPLATKTVTLEAGKNVDVTLTLDLTKFNNEILITIQSDNTELDRLLIQFVK
ncbi:MAG: hypothetical protein FWE88_05505 [Phycisphaerae bacterium]|nr:hypothetical protein [Phycisphaerae bacterium]